MKELPSNEEIAEAERRFVPGKVPIEIWYEHMRLNGSVTIELNLYRVVDDKIQFYMTRRPETDPFYPNQLHMPGTMLTGADTSAEDAIRRIKNKEVPWLIMDEPKNISAYIRKTPRGTEGVFMFTAQVYSGGSPDKWFDAENLPEDTVENHKHMAKISLEAIRKARQ
jgi:hypothetical protein